MGIVHHMNAALCRSCRRPLGPADAFCQHCGVPSGPSQQPPARQGESPLPYGAVPRGDPFAALGPGHRSPGPRSPGTPPAGDPGRPRRRRGNAGLIAGVLCAALLVAGVGITALVVGTGGDDGDDAAHRPSGHGSSGEPSDPGGQSSLHLPSPSSSSTVLTKTFTRTKATGGDREQVRQLVVDWSDWLDSIYAGDVGACDYMKLYLVTVPKKTLIGCRRSAATPLPNGDEITTKPGKITVNGHKGTVTIKYTYVLDGKSNHTSTEADVVKQNGTWYFTEQ